MSEIPFRESFFLTVCVLCFFLAILGNFYLSQVAKNVNADKSKNYRVS